MRLNVMLDLHGRGTQINMPFGEDPVPSIQRLAGWAECLKLLDPLAARVSFKLRFVLQDDEGKDVVRIPGVPSESMPQPYMTDVKTEADIQDTFLRAMKLIAAALARKPEPVAAPKPEKKPVKKPVKKKVPVKKGEKDAKVRRSAVAKPSGEADKGPDKPRRTRARRRVKAD